MKFPSPLEVDRFLYGIAEGRYYRYTSSFPAPLEVDRFLYILMSVLKLVLLLGFRPLAG